MDQPLLQAPADPFGELRRAVEVGSGQQEHELLPAPAADGVDVAASFLERPGELAENDVAGRMAVAVVDALEVVEIGQDDRKRPAETLDARELGCELVLELAAVGEAGEPVDPSLALDDPVQARVVERDHGLRRERRQRHLVVRLELVAEDEQRAEVDPAGDQRRLDLGRALVRIPRLHELAPLQAQD